jgi:hypothetical protein
MRLIPTEGVLCGPEGDCPPAPYLEIEDEEAANLIARGLAVEYQEEALSAVVEQAPEQPAPGSNTAILMAAVASADAAHRAQDIEDAVDLLEAGHFETKGPRAGKPKVQAVAEAAGIPDVTAEEIDAAIAAKGAAA